MYIAAVRSVEAERGEPITASALLEAAANEDSEGYVFHDRFEWDNTVAGHAFRLQQARQLLNGIRWTVEVERGDAEPQRYSVAAFVSAGRRDDQAESPYLSTSTVAGKKASLRNFADTVAAKSRLAEPWLSERSRKAAKSLVRALEAQLKT